MNWQKYWTSYPSKFDERDYFRQVKHTIGGTPIPDAKMHEAIAAISSRLDLQADDVLLDLCCGNGLFTREFAKRCRSVVGVDFSETLIQIAKTAHQFENITYVRMNALELSHLHSAEPSSFTKIVMNAGLQYFRKAEFPRLLRSIDSVLADSGVALITAIPDRRFELSFYNTTQRRLRHVWERIVGSDQMGTWWAPDGIEQTCFDQAFECTIYRTAGEVGTGYRFDVRLTRRVK